MCWRWEIILFQWWWGTKAISNQKEILSVENEFLSVIFIGRTEIICHLKYEDWLCVSIFNKDIIWYLGVIEKPHNYECLMYIFIGEVKDDTPNKFINLSKSVFFNNWGVNFHQFWFILHMTMFIFEFSSIANSNIWYNWPKKVNEHDFCYQCSKDGPDLSFGNWGLVIKIWTISPVERTTIPDEYYLKIMLQKDNGRKKGRFNMNRHKAMRILDYTWINWKRLSITGKYQMHENECYRSVVAPISWWTTIRCCCIFYYFLW